EHIGRLAQALLQQLARAQDTDQYITKRVHAIVGASLSEARKGELSTVLAEVVVGFMTDKHDARPIAHVPIVCCVDQDFRQGGLGNPSMEALENARRIQRLESGSAHLHRQFVRHHSALPTSCGTSSRAAAGCASALARYA